MAGNISASDFGRPSYAEGGTIETVTTTASRITDPVYARQENGAKGQKRETPRCRMEEDRDTWALTFGGYPAGIGFEVPFGEDDGNHFVTFRYGFGRGGGISYTPYASIPGPELQNPYQGGFVLSASGQLKFAAGPVSTKVEVGAARNYTEGNSAMFGGPNFSF